MTNLIEITKRAEKSLKKASNQVVVNFQIERSGLEAVQKIPGYNDETLKGRLAGIRSARLSDGYRI